MDAVLAGFVGCLLVVIGIVAFVLALRASVMEE